MSLITIYEDPTFFFIKNIPIVKIIEAGWERIEVAQPYKKDGH